MSPSAPTLAALAAESPPFANVKEPNAPASVISVESSTVTLRPLAKVPEADHSNVESVVITGLSSSHAVECVVSVASASAR